MANADDKAEYRRWSFDWWRVAARRVGYTLGFLVVAGVAARVSYGHIRDVVLHVGQPADVAYLLPLSVDGLMLIATLAMAEDKAYNRKPRGWARWGFWFGAGVSTAANVQAVILTSGVDALAIAVGAAAPVFLLWSIEIVSRPGKPRLVAVVQDALSSAVHAVLPATLDATPEVAVEVTAPEPEPTPVVEPEPEPVEDVKPKEPTRRRPARTTPSTGVKRVERPAITATVVDAVFVEPERVTVD